MGSGDVKDADIASAALAVALVALAIATTQLCGQLFATADGYRRCQPSVMGAWAQHTRLRWKWSEMRFETLFTTPEIFLLLYGPRSTNVYPNRNTHKEIKWIGEVPGFGFVAERSPSNDAYAHVSSLDSDLLDFRHLTGSHQEPACWLSFLQSVREMEFDSVLGVGGEHELYNSLWRPVCCPVQRSWDFMAPELLRPLAVTYVGDIAIIVQRLGMIWYVFRPEEGEMRAEGSGHIIYSTLVRSIGPILHYSHENARSKTYGLYKSSLSDHMRKERALIPTQVADMMRFGILACFHELMLYKEFTMGTSIEVQGTLDILDPTGSASKKVRDNRQLDPTSSFGFADLISMAAPMLRMKGSSRYCLSPPTEHCTGLSTHREGFVVFRYRLGEYLSKEARGNTQASRVQQMYDSLADVYPFWVEGVDANLTHTRFGQSFLERVQEAWDETDKYFRELASRKDLEDMQSFFPDLVACHIKHAVNFAHEAHNRIAQKTARNHFGLTDWLAEGMHLYWDYLPDIVEEMKYKAPEPIVQAAWITLIFRAFCWSRCHYFGPPHIRFPDSTRLPSRYWGSKLPVYLG
ncbi:MAG: hypothetical protein Q9218_003281 [Villophora microphyllina]